MSNISYTIERIIAATRDMCQADTYLLKRNLTQQANGDIFLLYLVFTHKEGYTEFPQVATRNVRYHWMRATSIPLVQDGMVWYPIPGADGARSADDLTKLTVNLGNYSEKIVLEDEKGQEHVLSQKNPYEDVVFRLNVSNNIQLGYFHNPWTDAGVRGHVGTEYAQNVVFAAGPTRNDTSFLEKFSVTYSLPPEEPTKENSRIVVDKFILRPKVFFNYTIPVNSMEGRGGTAVGKSKIDEILRNREGILNTLKKFFLDKYGEQACKRLKFQSRSFLCQELATALDASTSDNQGNRSVYRHGGKDVVCFAPRTFVNPRAARTPTGTFLQKALNKVSWMTFLTANNNYGRMEGVPETQIEAVWAEELDGTQHDLLVNSFLDIVMHKTKISRIVAEVADPVHGVFQFELDYYVWNSTTGRENVFIVPEKNIGSEEIVEEMCQAFKEADSYGWRNGRVEQQIRSVVISGESVFAEEFKQFVKHWNPSEYSRRPDDRALSVYNEKAQSWVCYIPKEIAEDKFPELVMQE